MLILHPHHLTIPRFSVQLLRDGLSCCRTPFLSCESCAMRVSTPSLSSIRRYHLSTFLTSTGISSSPPTSPSCHCPEPSQTILYSQAIQHTPNFAFGTFSLLHLARTSFAFSSEYTLHFHAHSTGPAARINLALSSSAPRASHKPLELGWHWLQQACRLGEVLQVQVTWRCILDRSRAVLRTCDPSR